MLNRTPLVNQVTATLDWSKPDGAGANHASYPAAAKDASGYLIESLWSYSGFVKATTAGTYQFKLIADDSAAIYVQHGDQLVSETTTWQDRAGGGKVISVDLAAGETAPIWVFFKPQAGDSYWGDEVHLTWKTPDDAAFAAIPADQLVATPSSLVSASTGFAQAYLPFASTDTTSTNGLGLQLRVLDTSSYLYSGAATGLDRYLTAELLGQTPIYSGTATPDLDVKPVGGNSGEGVPSAILNASGQVKDSLWVYSGYLLPKVSGSYTFSFDADDDGRVYIGSGAQTTSVSSWVNDGDPKTVAVDLQAGEVVPLWVFFKSQAPGGYWGDWVNLKWKLPGDADFTAIPVEQMAPTSDALVHPNAGYPASLLPFDFDAGSASALVGSTQIAGTPTFSALGAQPSTQLTQDWNIAAQSDDISVVSGSHFERSFSVPTEWAGGNMQHWLNLVVRQVDGTLSEITPLEYWEFTTATTAAGTSLSINGTVDSTPNLDVAGLRIYSDDNLLDATAPAILNIPLNQALQAPAFSSDGSLSIYGSSGNDVLDAEYYSITGGTGSSASDANPNTVHGGDGNDKIYGSNTGADILKGDAGDDFILGRGGDDTIYGGGLATTF